VQGSKALYFYPRRSPLPSKAAKGSPLDHQYPDFSAATGAKSPLPRYFADMAVDASAVDIPVSVAAVDTQAPGVAGTQAPVAEKVCAVVGRGCSCGGRCHQAVGYNDYT